MSISHLDSSVRPSKRAATYQDVLDAPPNMVAEIINGELYSMPRPAPPHGKAQSVLLGWVQSLFGFGGGGGSEEWHIITEPELHLGKHVLVPDVGGWRLSRMRLLPKTAYFSVSPDWVCEVLSDSTRKNDLGPKRLIYAAQGVEFYWLIDPTSRSLEVLVQKEEVWSRVGTYTGDSEVWAPPFESCPLLLKNLWAGVSVE